MVDVWTAEDEEQLVRLSNKQIDMSETFLGRYAAIQKRTAVAAVLDFTDEEWESLTGIRLWAQICAHLNLSFVIA
jgi:hypothetical protein